MKKVKSNPVFVVPSISVDALEPLGKDHSSFNEEFLQELLADHGEILPVQNLRPDVGPLLCIGREIPVGGSGTLDNLYLSTSGYPILVETKLWRNSQSRREVLAQTIDYLKEIVQKDFDWFAKQWTMYQKKRGAPSKDLIAALSELAGEELDESGLIDRVNELLKKGDLIALIVGDGIETRLQELIDYLCQDSAHWRYTLALVELTCYRLSKYDPNGLIVIPQIVQNVEPIQRAYIRIDVAKELANEISVCSVAEPERSTRRRESLNESDFLQLLEENRGRLIRDQIQEFYSGLADTYGLVVEVTPTSLFLKYPHPIADFSGVSVLGIDNEGRVYNPKVLRFLLNRWQINSETTEEIVRTYWKALNEIDPRFGLDGLKPISSKRFPPFEELKPKLLEIREQVGNVVSRIQSELADDV